MEKSPRELRGACSPFPSAASHQWEDGGPWGPPQRVTPRSPQHWVPEGSWLLGVWESHEPRPGISPKAQSWLTVLCVVITDPYRALGRLGGRGHREGGAEEEAPSESCSRSVVTPLCGSYAPHHVTHMVLLPSLFSAAHLRSHVLARSDLFFFFFF